MFLEFDIACGRSPETSGNILIDFNNDVQLFHGRERHGIEDSLVDKATE